MGRLTLTLGVGCSIYHPLIYTMFSHFAVEPLDFNVTIAHPILRLNLNVEGTSQPRGSRCQLARNALSQTGFFDDTKEYCLLANLYLRNCCITTWAETPVEGSCN